MDLNFILNHGDVPPPVPQPQINYYDVDYLRTMGMRNKADPYGSFNRTFIARCEGATSAEEYNTYMENYGIQELNWQNRAGLLNQTIHAIANLHVGYRTTCSLMGHSLGDICRRLVEEYGRNILKGLFVTGQAYDFKTSVANGDPVHMYDPIRDEDRWFTPKNVERSLDRVVIRYFPLSKVDYSYGNVPGYEPWNDYYSTIIEREGGSDLSGYCFFDDAYICRMAPAANSVMRKIKNTRTAGLSNVITRDWEQKITFTTPRLMLSEDDDLNPVDRHEYTLYMPSGDQNCVESAFLYLLRKICPGEQWGDWAKEIFKIMKTSGKKRKLKKVRKMGFTTKDLRVLYESAKTMGLFVHIYYEYDEVRWGDRIGKFGGGIIRNSEENENYNDHFCILQMNEQGFIFSNLLQYFNADSLSGVSNLLHAIAIYPHPPKKFFHSVVFRDEFRKAIEAVTSLKMKQYVAEMKGAEILKESEVVQDLKPLVEYQNNRYIRDLTNTLIFKERKHEISSSVIRKKKRNNLKPDTYIFAYDLETVLNSNDCQEKVWEPFRKTIYPNSEPLEVQIPFSAQWCVVNVSDDENGKYAKRKNDEGIQLNTYQSDLSPGATIPSPKPGEEPYKQANFLITNPVTEYGDYQLGKCVEDMLQNMANEVLNREGKYGVAYAHNGAGFDAYVVLQFCRYPVHRILKTSRGVMSVTIMVPVHDEGEIDVIDVPISLRDTRLHVAGSLAMLCKGFAVPKEWCKLDFPIGKVNYLNCYTPEVMEICKPYGENDVKALAFIIVQINKLIAESRWEPCDVHNSRPPIAQFLTCMSMVRASTRNHFLKSAKVPQDQLPKAIDVPALRIWLEKATIGGRVNAYAKTYVSKYWDLIVDAYMENDVEKLKELSIEIRKTNACMRVLDVTSLYPTTQAKCPMPTGKLFFMNEQEARESIDRMKCDECEKFYHLCEKHDLMKNGGGGDMRPFAIIRVKNLRWTEEAKKTQMRVMCARRLRKESMGGLEYSLENEEEMAARYYGEDMGDKPPIMPEVHAFTNIDLYWMEKSGFSFTIIDAFGFYVSGVYHSFIAPAFQERIQAKKDGNKLLSDFLKLNYNGSFGITAQQNITATTAVITLPEELRHLHPSDDLVVSHIIRNHSTELGPDEEIGDDSYMLPSGQTLLSKKKKSSVAEYYMEQSPVQIGCAILAYARHIMNLIMFPLPASHQTYTDTDSIALSEECCLQLEKAGIINNRDDAPLGTLKNDHLDGNGCEPRVVCSLIGTKKVKQHITLNEKGEIRVYNTFKGLNPADTNDRGEKMTGDYVEYHIASALNQISQFGSCAALKVSQWRKSLAFGVKIGEHMQEMAEETYMGHSKGLLMWKDEKSGNLFEFFIPHGSTMFSGLGAANENFLILKKDGSVCEHETVRKTYLKSLWEKNMHFYVKYFNMEQGGKTHDATHRLESTDYDFILKVFEKINGNVRNSGVDSSSCISSSY